MDYKVGDVVECIVNNLFPLARYNRYTVTGVIHATDLTYASITVNWIDGTFPVHHFVFVRHGSNKFYMIYREDSRLPEVKYTSAAKATAEAQRLAKKHPGSKIFILETVDCFLCSVSEPESVDLEEL